MRDNSEAHLAIHPLRTGTVRGPGNFRITVLPPNDNPGSMMIVSQTPNSRRTGRPRNPGVRELIAGKRQWASPQEKQQAEALRGFRGWHARGYLPHRDEPGLVQFISFHLADSYPAALRAEWEALLQVEDDLERHRQLEVYLDKGRGVCHLRDPEIAGLVDAAFRFYHGKHYDLRAWVVMPNHVHVQFKVGETSLGKIVRQLKEYTAREANKLLKRHGQFWADDCWDTYMRNWEHELQTRHYIENNPVKAGLVWVAKEWAWSSARFRDDTGELRL